MAEEHVERRLAAVMAADVVGYSRMMEHDEDGTLSRLKSLRRELFDPKTKKYGGRIFKVTGDGALVEFKSAVDAVKSAIDIQKALAARNQGQPESQQIELRIGISMGDVIVEGSDLYGNGVNVAARMEGLAEPKGICVSGNVHEHVRNLLDMPLEDLGEQQIKNLDRPIRCYRVNMGSKAERAHTAPARSDKRSIAVLPFTNMSSDVEQEYFADGISEDLITDLSKISGLFVVARNTSFAFKGKSPDIKDVGRELGVQHILEGSVRRAGNQIRINAQLIDAVTGGHLWAERYDSEFDNIFALQDDISAKIISALEVRLTATDLQKVDRRPTLNAEAYDLFLKGRAGYYAYSPADMAEAKQYREKAIEIDPNYADAYGYLSGCKVYAYIFAWPGADKTLDKSLALAEKSVALNDRSAVAYTRLAWVQSFLGHFESASANFETAISLDPYNAEAFYAYGEAMNRWGSPEKALSLLEKAYSIDSIFPPTWLYAEGHSLILLGRFEEALAKIGPVIERAPFFLPGRVQMARALGETDQTGEAEMQVEAILKLAPNLNAKNVETLFPYPDKKGDYRRLLKILRDAGLPE